MKNDFDNILEIADSKNYELLITLSHYDTDENYNYCINLVGKGKCKYVSSYYVYLIKNDYVPEFKINSNGWIYSDISSNVLVKTIKIDSNYNTSYQNLIAELNNSDFSNFSSGRQSTGSGKQWYYFQNNNNEMIYGSSDDYTITSLDSSENIYYFVDKKITKGSLLPTYKNYIKTYDTYSLSIFPHLYPSPLKISSVFLLLTCTTNFSASFIIPARYIATNFI